jgi:hypothetical protein
VGEYREIRNERLYLKEPGTERLRKGSAGRLRHLLATGWREVERWYAPHFVTVRMERSGQPPLPTKLPRTEGAPARASRGRGRGGRWPAGPGGQGRRGGP